MRFVSLIAVSVVALAQQNLSIIGTAREGSQGPPLAGVEVKLKEFRTVDGFVTGILYRTTYTDAGGEFEFKPERFGNYFLEARKPGYWRSDAPFTDTDAAEAPVTLTEMEPQKQVPFSMVRPSFIEGQFVDENNELLANHTLWIERAPNSGPALVAVTGVDGAFVSPKLQPGNYLVRIGPQTGDLPPRQVHSRRRCHRRS